jgi:GTP pyrophosphokinase
MKITDTEMYTYIAAKLKATESDRQKYIKNFQAPLNKKIKELEIPFTTTARIKAISSIANKIRKKKIPFEEVYDLFAVRIIVDVPADKEKSSCWQVYSLITDTYSPIPERLKDWVTTPKGNGYESLHTTVIGPNGRFVEVQIRSQRMNEIAEKGFAAHWKYKEVKSNDNVYDRWLANIREILDANHSDALEFLNDFKTNLFSEEIYVFTPNGDMKILPKGATALDFAIDIHSDIGYKATAIKVNNKLVPMGYKLSNGDQVSVTTQKNQRPNENWLKMVVTGKARSKIRSSMKEERRKKGELGKEALMRKLKNLKVSFEENVDMLVKHFGFISRPDLYFALSTEAIKISDLKVFKVEGNKLVLKEEEASGDIAPKDEAPKAAPKSKVSNKSKILVNGESADQYEFMLAQCCNPVHGENIFGYLTATKGLKIHRTNCSNATHLMANYGYRILKADWADRVKSNYTVELLIIGVDSGVGVIQGITGAISDKLGINIRAFNIEGDEGFFEAKVSLVVINKDQLNVVIKEIKSLEQVHTVTRVDKYSK